MGEGNEKIEGVTDYSLAELREALREAKQALGGGQAFHNPASVAYAGVKKALAIAEVLEERERQIELIEAETDRGLF